MLSVVTSRPETPELQEYMIISPPSSDPTPGSLTTKNFPFPPFICIAVPSVLRSRPTLLAPSCLVDLHWLHFTSRVYTIDVSN